MIKDRAEQKKRLFVFDSGNRLHECLDVICTVNQQILAAIKFGVSQNKVIWR